MADVGLHLNYPGKQLRVSCVGLCRTPTFWQTAQSQLCGSVPHPYFPAAGASEGAGGAGQA